MSAQDNTVTVGRGELTCDFCKATRPLAEYEKIMEWYGERQVEQYLAGYECPECGTVEEM